MRRIRAGHIRIIPIIFGILAICQNVANAQVPVIAPLTETEKSGPIKPINISVLIDEALFSDKLCKAVSETLEGSKTPWGWSLGLNKGCSISSSEPKELESLFDWLLYFRASEKSLTVELCRPRSDLSSANKICFASVSLQDVPVNGDALAKDGVMLLVMSALLEQSPFFMNNPKLDPRRVRIDRRLPRELQKSLRSVPVDVSFEEQGRVVKLLEAGEQREKSAYMNFTLSGAARKSQFEKQITELLNPDSKLANKPVTAVPWIPPLPLPSVKKEEPEMPKGDESPILFDVELAQSVYGKEVCHIFQSLFDTGVGPWFLKLGDFSACVVQSETSRSSGSLNRWKVTIETSGSELEAAVCRPTGIKANDKPTCYAQISVEAKNGFADALRDVRFVNLLLAALYELAPITAYGPFDTMPGDKDKRLPSTLADPPSLRPMELKYVKGGQLYRLVEIRADEKFKRAGDKVFWSRTKNYKNRREDFIQALNSLAEEINFNVRSVTLTDTFKHSAITKEEQLAAEKRLKAANAAAAARESARKAEIEAREAAEQAAAAKALAAAKEKAAREAAMREAKARAIAAQEAEARERAAREAAREAMRQAERDAAIREAMAKADAAREAALRAEAAARAALAAAKEEVAILEDQLPQFREGNSKLPARDLRFSIFGMPIQEKFRVKTPANFRAGFEAELWGDDSLNLGVWADFTRVFYSQKFVPDVIPNDIDDPSLVTAQTAMGERSQSRLGLTLATIVQQESSLLSYGLQLGSASFTSQWTYDRNSLTHALGQIDGTAALVGASVSLVPLRVLGGFLFYTGADALWGRGLSGNTYTMDVGWRFLKYSGNQVRRLQAKFDLVTGAQILMMNAKSVVDNETDLIRSNSLHVGLRVTLL